MSLTVGVDVGGTKILGVAVDPEGRVVARRRDSSHDDLGVLVDRIEAIVDALRAATDRRSSAVRAVGVGVAGMVTHDGVVAYSPNLPKLRRAPLHEALAGRLDVPVAVDNDANAAALAELTLGVAVGVGDWLLVTLGTGIGGAIVRDGRVVRGAHGFAAEVGHVPIESDGRRCACGGRGHWETIASGSALAAMARDAVASGAARALLERAGGDIARLDGVHVADAAREGDPEARALVERLADGVARGVAGLVATLDPEIVVLSGGVVEMGDLLVEPARASLGRYLEGAALRPPVPLLVAHLGADAGAIGAAVLARAVS